MISTSGDVYLNGNVVRIRTSLFVYDQEMGVLQGSILSPYVYCRTHNVSVCLYIAYIACGSVSLYIKTLYFFLTVLALSVAATVANIKIRYDAKIPQFAIFGIRVIYVFYSRYCRNVFPDIVRLYLVITGRT